MPNQWTLGLKPIGPSDEQLAALCEAAEEGYSMSACASTADVTYHTLVDWLRLGRKALDTLRDDGELTSTQLIYASVAEQFDKARARGVKRLEDISTERAKAGLGTWSEAITKLERGHRKEWGRQPETAALGGTITLVIEGRPARQELPDVEGRLSGGEADRRELPAAPPTSSVQE